MDDDEEVDMDDDEEVDMDDLQCLPALSMDEEQALS